MFLVKKNIWVEKFLIKKCENLVKQYFHEKKFGSKMFENQEIIVFKDNFRTKRFQDT